MDLSTAILLGIVALLAVNQLVLRIPALLRTDAVFYGLLLVEIVVGTAIMALGLPGFEDMPAVSWVMGLLFFLHVAQNLSYRQRRMRALAEDDDAERRRRAEQIRAKLVDDPERPDAE